MTNFDMNWIVVFNAIYEEKTLTRAAERLEMSEKTLGLILKKLRDYFSDPLFIRSNAGFTATPVANELYLKFYKTQMYLQQALTPHAADSDKGADKTIILSVPTHSEFVFNQIYSNVAELFSGYSIQLHAAESAEKEINNLRRGFTDIYISLDPLEDSFITNEVISTISKTLCLIARKDHVNASRIAQGADLSSEKFISCTLYPFLEEYFIEHMAFTPKIVYRSQSLVNLLSVTEQRDVILIAPVFFATMLQLENKFHITYIDTDNSMIKTAYCSHLKNSNKINSIKEITRLIKNESLAMKQRASYKSS